MKLEGHDGDFIVIGENIHTTRVYLRKGVHIDTPSSGVESVRFENVDGEECFLPISEDIRNSQDFEGGRVKHVKVAVQAAMGSNDELAALGSEYLEAQIRRQIDLGADFLDLNVDEISLDKRVQQEAMEWLVGFVQERSSVPLCIDSSNPDTLEVGLKTCDNRAGRTMLNSASLERIGALDLVGKYDSCVIVSAAGESGMPQNAAERVKNASRITDAAVAKGIALSDIFIDPLMFPISVDQQYGNHVFEAIRQLREKYGPDIRITGGFSNVSFGLPCRKLINDVFTVLAIEAGADSGIVDPVANDLGRVFTLDRTSDAWEHARALLVGEDPDCMMYLLGFRSGLFADY
jgi:5-methyltetrahydrofolate--homocysteine methyltransferase